MTPIDKLPVPLRGVAEAAWAGDRNAYENAMSDALNDQLFDPTDDDGDNHAFGLLCREFSVHGWNSVPPLFDRTAAPAGPHLPDALIPPFMVPLDMLPQCLSLIVEAAWSGQAAAYRAAVLSACEERGEDRSQLDLGFYHWGWDGLPMLYRGDGPLGRAPRPAYHDPF